MGNLEDLLRDEACEHAPVDITDSSEQHHPDTPHKHVVCARLPLAECPCTLCVHELCITRHVEPNWGTQKLPEAARDPFKEVHVQGNMER